jgi:hypothetical protein
LFLAEFNHLKLWSTDIGNAYLEAYTSEKVYIIAGPEIGDREGHILIISKSLYGWQSSGLRWHVPEPLGNHVTLTHYVDANLMYDIAMGSSVTGILHLMNKRPIEWYSKKQATVETATYGSEFVAARICTEHIIDLRNTLRFLKVPIERKTTCLEIPSL